MSQLTYNYMYNAGMMGGHILPLGAAGQGGAGQGSVGLAWGWRLGLARGWPPKAMRKDLFRRSGPEPSAY